MRFQGIAPVSNGQGKKQTPVHKSERGSSGTPLAHRRPGYPSSSCSPAELDSVSPGLSNVTEAVSMNKAKEKQSGQGQCLGMPDR
jgi:hypothetical protein